MIQKDTGSISALRLIRLAKEADISRLALSQAIAQIYGVAEFIDRRVAISIRTGIILQWETFYKDYFGLVVNLSFVKIPIHRIGFERIIIMLEQLSTDDIITVHPRIIPTKKLEYTASDNIYIRPRTDYAIRVRNSIFPDRNLHGLSANNVHELKVRSMTLGERLIFGLKLFHETGRHLDTSTFTLCSGSRYTDDTTVPRVYFHNGHVVIGYQKVRVKDKKAGAREVIL